MTILELCHSLWFRHCHRCGQQRDARGMSWKCKTHLEYNDIQSRSFLSPSQTVIMMHSWLWTCCSQGLKSGNVWSSLFKMIPSRLFDRAVGVFKSEDGAGGRLLWHSWLHHMFWTVRWLSSRQHWASISNRKRQPREKVTVSTLPLS